jgi:thiamine biosynthesis lipoprotein
LAVPEKLDPGALRDFDPKAEMVDLTGATMGTTWRVRLALARNRQAEKLRPVIEATLNRITAQMSHWDSSSQLCAFNLAPAGTWINLDDDFAHVIAGALRIAAQSDGAFDPAAGRLTATWGLGPVQLLSEPSAAELADALAHSGWARLAFESHSRRLHQPGGVWLDLSGIAKGYAADAVAEALAEQGIHHVLVEIGGECTGRGIRPDGDPWWIDVETAANALPPLRVALCQLAIATSGDYLRGAHTIDPRLGRPAIHGTTSVTVIHDSCMEADAWATALGTAEPDAARMMAEHFGLKARLVDRAGDEWLSCGLRAMM